MALSSFSPPFLRARLHPPFFIQFFCAHRRLIRPRKYCSLFLICGYSITSGRPSEVETLIQRPSPLFNLETCPICARLDLWHWRLTAYFTLHFSGPEMLVAFHSSPFSAPLQSGIPNRGFELNVDILFADSDSYDFAQGQNNKCEFHINASKPGEYPPTYLVHLLHENAPQCNAAIHCSRLTVGLRTTSSTHRSSFNWGAKF